jgi:hypothetical protein
VEEEQAVRWNIKVSKETDLILRTFLGSQGMRKGDLSKFIEDAVRWRVFNRTVQDIKAKKSEERRHGRGPSPGTRRRSLG